MADTAMGERERSADHTNFVLIVHTAKQSGWLPRDSSLSYEEFASYVQVYMRSAEGVCVRRYSLDGQWLLRFLNEVAHRKWLSLGVNTGDAPAN